MKPPIEQFTESAKEVRLGSEAYARMRARLVAHMRLHPAELVPVVSPYQRFLSILSPFASTLKRPVAMLAMAALVVVGGGSTYAAAGALPGNPLYPLKVKVIEPVQGLLAVTSEAKAEWHASITNKRLAEVEELAKKEILTPEEGVKSQDRFDRSLEAAQATLTKLSQENPGAAKKIEESFAAALGEKEDALEMLGVSTTSRNAKEAREFAGHIREKVGEAFKNNPDALLRAKQPNRDDGAGDAQKETNERPSKDEQDADRPLKLEL